MPLPTPTGAIRSRGLLWCEGPHDFAFLRRMLGYLGVSEHLVRVEVFEGVPLISTYLTTLSLRPGFADLKAPGIVRDADEEASAALSSVRSHLERNGLSVPDSHGLLTNGLSFDGHSRSVGVFIAPDGETPGALETSYLRAVGAGPLVNCVRDFMQCVSPHVEHSRVAQFAKVEFHAWLATCPQPGILPGQAMDANYIDRNSAAFGPIRDFLTQLAAAASEPLSPPA